jgi:hypothetical protein
MPRSLAPPRRSTNPDHVSIVIHNYRWRLSVAEGDSRYDDLERRLAEGPVIAVPMVIPTALPQPRMERPTRRSSLAKCGLSDPVYGREGWYKPSGKTTDGGPATLLRSGGDPDEINRHPAEVLGT